MAVPRRTLIIGGNATTTGCVVAAGAAAEMEGGKDFVLGIGEFRVFFGEEGVVAGFAGRGGRGGVEVRGRWGL